MRKRTRRHEMKYLVGIPIPYLDRHGKRLRPSRVKVWIEKAAYRAVMKVVGVKRGRPVGDKTVQAKLLLPQPVYSALKKEAKRSNVTMSRLVAETLKAHLPRHA